MADDPCLPYPEQDLVISKPTSSWDVGETGVVDSVSLTLN